MYESCVQMCVHGLISVLFDSSRKGKQEKEVNKDGPTWKQDTAFEEKNLEYIKIKLEVLSYKDKVKHKRIIWVYTPM